MVKLIRSSNDLSRASDHDFQMSFAPLRRQMDTIAEKILQKYAHVLTLKIILFFSLLTSMTALLKQQSLPRDLGGVSWKEADNEEKIEKLIDLNDILFERIVTCCSTFSLSKRWPLAF